DKLAPTVRADSKKGGLPGKIAGAAPTKKQILEESYGEAPLPTPAFVKSGAELGTLYHAGNRKVTQIDPSALQSRDYGFYGKGFYGSKSEHGTRGYGNKVTSFSLKPDAKVLMSALRPEDANPALVEAVKRHALESGTSAAAKRGKLNQLRDEVEHIDKS